MVNIKLGKLKLNFEETNSFKEHLNNLKDIPDSIKNEVNSTMTDLNKALSILNEIKNELKGKSEIKESILVLNKIKEVKVDLKLPDIKDYKEATINDLKKNIKILKKELADSRRRFGVVLSKVNEFSKKFVTFKEKMSKFNIRRVCRES